MSAAENIRVICRVRPPNAKELAKSNKPAVHILNERSLQTDAKTTFTYDAVLPPTCTQDQAYEIIGKPIVESVLKGYNGTIFAYGQTSSGKTYTMEGNPENPQLKGIIPRLVEDVFNNIAEMEGNLQFLLKVSFLEIYMEKVKDLLDITKENLPIGETKERVPYVKGATERFVSTPEEVLYTLEEGRAIRKVAETKMNERSSRSHSVFILTVMSEDKVTTTKKCGQMFLVDLAGSEKVSKSGAQGLTLDEAKTINLSLSSLGSVINALVEKQSHVPYRDSKLTRILQNSLGGNSKTTLVICVSPSEYNQEETRSTLFFGTRAKSIKNQVTANVQVTAEEWKTRYEELLEKYQKLRTAFELLLMETKRWRAGEKVPESERVQDGKVLAETALSSGTSKGATMSPKSQSERRRSMGEPTDAAMQSLYRTLDMKDEELSAVSQQLAKSKVALQKATSDLEMLKVQMTQYENDHVVLQKSLQTNRSEMREVLTALEELATNYDRNIQEKNKKQEELEKLQETVNKLNDSKSEFDAKLRGQSEHLNTERSQWTTMVSGLVKEVGDVADVINPNMAKPSKTREITFEGEVMTMRLFLSKIKSEANNLKRTNAEIEKAKQVAEIEGKDAQSKLRAAEGKIKELKLNVDQQMDLVKAAIEAQTASQNKSTALMAENARLESLVKASKGEGLDKSQLPVAVATVTNQLKGEFTAAQDKLNKKTHECLNLQTENVHLKHEIETLQKEKMLLETSLADSKKRMDSLQAISDRRDEAKRELNSLEENVLRELETLHNLRNMFVTDLKDRVNKLASVRTTPQNQVEDIKQEVIAEQYGTLHQKERIAQLENQTENLSKKLKTMVQDLTLSQNDQSKMEKRLKAAKERINVLENELSDSRHNALAERKRYQVEMMKMKELMKNKAFRSPWSENIAKPVPAGRANLAKA